MMVKHNIKTKQMYEFWTYPNPISDVKEYYREGRYQKGDPKYFWYQYWQNIEKKKLKILIAGCGTHQATLLAYNNPEHDFIGIDLSSNAIRYSNKIAKKHRLKNVIFRKMDILDCNSLNIKFDLIISTGVLHHMEDPIAGGKALANQMSENGKMFLMLYDKNMRSGVYMLQDIFRLLNYKYSEESINKIKELLQQLPPHHPAVQYIKSAQRDMSFDAGIADIFLHPQETSFNVQEIYDFSEKIGLKFQCWHDNIKYSAEANLNYNHPLYKQISQLNWKERSICISNYCNISGNHDFILSKNKTDYRNFEECFLGSEVESFIPHFVFGFKKSPKKINKLDSWIRKNKTFGVSNKVNTALDLINGVRNIGSIIDLSALQLSISKEEASGIVKKGFLTMYDMGNIIFDFE